MTAEPRRREEIVEAMARPVRVVLRRTKGWKMPENTVKVDQSTPWGNPFIPGKSGGAYTGGRIVADRRHAWRLYQAVAPLNEDLVARARAELRGKNLACWCALDDPYEDVCHAAVLLKIANCEEAALTAAERLGVRLPDQSEGEP